MFSGEGIVIVVLVNVRVGECEYFFYERTSSNQF
jgi:hypothetical protein